MVAVWRTLFFEDKHFKPQAALQSLKLLAMSAVYLHLLCGLIQLFLPSLLTYCPLMLFLGFSFNNYSKYRF